MIQRLFDFVRLVKIVSVFFEAGFFALIKRIGLSWCVGWRCRIRCWWGKKHCHEPNLSKELRGCFEKLGPLFMKLGQILSMRPDAIPPEYIEELKLLQDQAPPVAFSDIEKTIQRELKGKMEDHFKSFDQKALASASLGQVHAARLKSGDKVAVKVQRPNIVPLIERDLRLLRFLVRLLEKHVPEVAHYRPGRMLQTFSESLHRELDYEVEGRNADRFAYNFKDEKGILIPNIYWEHTSKKVLTMEFIEGIKMGDLVTMKDRHIRHMKLMKNCTRGCLLPIFKFGFFHADPHPGNVWALGDNRIAYLDFGMVGVMHYELRQKMMLFFLFLTQENIDGALYYLEQMLEKEKGAKVEGFMEEAKTMMMSFFLHKESQDSISSIFNEIIGNGVRFGVYFPPELVMLAKALVTGETMCRITHPKFDLLKTSRPLIEEIFEDEFSVEKFLSVLKIQGFDTLVHLPKFAEKMIKEYLKEKTSE